MEKLLLHALMIMDDGLDQSSRVVEFVLWTLDKDITDVAIRNLLLCDLNLATTS